MTDLTDREIVLGKLAARLTPVMVLVAATLPVMELLSLLGGVDPDALVKAFVVTVGVGVLGCCLALVFSIWMRRTHEGLARYAVWGLWLLARPMLAEINRTTGLTWIGPSLGVGTLLAGFRAYWRPDSVDGQLPGLSSPGRWAFLRPGSARRLHDPPRLHARRRPRPGSPRAGKVIASAPSLMTRIWTGRDRRSISTRCCGASGIAPDAGWGRVVGLPFVVLAVPFA